MGSLADTFVHIYDIMQCDLFLAFPFFVASPVDFSNVVNNSSIVVRGGMFDPAKCYRGIDNLELWGRAIRGGSHFKVSTAQECCQAYKSLCNSDGCCPCNSWVFCGDKECGEKFGEVTGQIGESEKLIKPSFLVQARQFLIAMVVMDTWQYFVHRYMHHNKFLYRHIHSRHHKLVVPYAFGALCNHPLEGLLLDTVSGALSFLYSGMTPRTSIYFFSFTTIKTMDDHCGLWLPGNPFHLLFQNNTTYHDIHHQLYGTKYNFSQPFFVMWDKILSTYMPYKIQNRSDGGFVAWADKD